jgi:hypothetical protein
MLDILRKSGTKEIDEQEDLFFCRMLDEGGYNLAPREKAMRFCVEEVFYPDPVGVHRPRQLRDSARIDSLFLGVRYEEPGNPKRGAPDES